MYANFNRYVFGEILSKDHNWCVFVYFDICINILFES